MPDQRKQSNPKTVNEFLLDREIRHALYMTRLAGGEAKWLQSKIPELRRRLVRELAPILMEMDTSGVLTPAQLELIDEASKKAAQVSREFYGDLSKEAMERQILIANSEIQFEQRIFQAAVPITFNYAIPSDMLVRATLSSQPIAGRAMTQWFKDIPADLVAKINNQLQQGILLGESNQDLMKRIRGTRKNGFKDGLIDRSGRQASDIVRTGVMGASNRARNMFHQENRNLIKGFDWVLTLDNRTCTICAAGEADGPYEVDNPPDLPAHVNCRCVLVAIVKSWEELGLDLEEAAPGTRATMNGQRADALTYAEWFEGQSEADKLEILGPARYKAYQNGLEVTEFADRGRILTLDELIGLEPDLFD